jgi:hypothetical protein
MSHMLQDCAFFSVPQFVIRTGLWPRLKPSQQSLYVGLLHEAERYRSRELLRTDAQLFELCGVSNRSLRNARIKLQEHGLIGFRPLRNGHLYTICDPRTGKPFPGGAKDKKAPSADGGTRNAPGSSPAPPMGTRLSFP